MQPPGKRTKPGCRSASAWTMSARRPPGRFFQVFCGNSEMKSRSMVALPSTRIVSHAFGIGVIGTQRGGDLLPVAGEILEIHRVEDRAIAAVELHAQQWFSLDAADLRGEIVGLALAHAHPAEAFVGDAERGLAFRLQADVVRVRRG